jgi:hypothetical protein
MSPDMGSYSRLEMMLTRCLGKHSQDSQVAAPATARIGRECADVPDFRYFSRCGIVRPYKSIIMRHSYYHWFCIAFTTAEFSIFVQYVSLSLASLGSVIYLPSHTPSFRPHLSLSPYLRVRMREFTIGQVAGAINVGLLFCKVS